MKKKSVGKKHYINSLNLILVAIVIFELMIVVNGVSVGNAIKSIAPRVLDSSTQKVVKPVCAPSAEICDEKDNDCDGEIDEGGVCEEIRKVYHPLLQEEYRETIFEYERRMENYQKYLAGDPNIKEEDFVPLTRWAGPEDSRPLTKEESEKIRPLKKYDVAKVSETSLGGRSNLVYVLVDEEIYDSINFEIFTYMSDLENEGYGVELYVGNYGTPEELKILLQTGLPDIVGAVFVGDLPVAWFENDDAYYGYSEFPMDLFYMDLDGIWEDVDSNGKYDSHTGSKETDIWVGRIDATTLNGNLVELYQNYFYKNHLYKIGELNLPSRILNYVDDDWSSFAGIWNNDSSYLYDYRQLVEDKDGTNAEDYKERITWNYDWISVFVHSWSGGHVFYSETVTDGEVYPLEIEQVDPTGLFYNLFACSAARMTEEDYLAGKYLFADTYGVAVIGSTKAGSMLGFSEFYGPLGNGSDLGDAFREWFNDVGLGSITWHYGMVILGDPTLSPNMPNDYPISHISNLKDYSLFTGQKEIIGTSKEGYLESTFVDYDIQVGSGLFPSSWSSESITLNDGGNNVVEGDSLGLLDSSQFENGMYVLKLTTYGVEGQTEYKTVFSSGNGWSALNPIHDGYLSKSGSSYFPHEDDQFLRVRTSQNPIDPESRSYMKFNLTDVVLTPYVYINLSLYESGSVEENCPRLYEVLDYGSFGVEDWDVDSLKYIGRFPCSSSVLKRISLVLDDESPIMAFMIKGDLPTGQIKYSSVEHSYLKPELIFSFEELEETPVTGCFDNDGGLNYFTKSFCTDSYGTYWDYCTKYVSEDYTLLEYYCPQGSLGGCASTWYWCDNDCSEGQCISLLCGDASGDGIANINDAIYLIQYIFNNGPAPIGNADVNEDGSVSITDAVYLIQWIFNNGPAPCEVPSNYVAQGEGWTQEQVTNYMNSF